MGIIDKETTEFFRKLVKDMMEMRKKSNTPRKDFLQLLLELKEKGSIAADDDDEEKSKNVESEDSNSARGSYSN